MRSVLIFTLLIAVQLESPLPAGEVVTIAGTGREGYSGNGGPAASAQVGGPFGVTLGPDGALYVCEISNHVIRRIDEQTGHISTVAGTGQKGYAGDGGPATEALLNEPYEVRFDHHSHMYFVEMRNHIVRRVDAKSGVISTVAGNGTQGFSGDGGSAVKAQLNVPHSIALDDSEHLYICDIGNHRVRRVDLKTGVIETFAGTGKRQPTPDGAALSGTPLNGPRALDFDGSHSLFLALREGNAVYRIDLNNQTLHHIAGTGAKGYTGDGGNARLATLAGPKGICVGPEGDLFLADTENHVIRAIRGKTGVIETIAGDGRLGDGPDGPPLSCRLARPHGVFADRRGHVYIGDSSNHRVRKVIGAHEKFARQVHVFYYPWFRNPKTDGHYDHWNHPVLVRNGPPRSFPGGDDIGANFYPQLGCYSTRDSRTVRLQMQQMQSAGIDVVSLSWWGKDSATDKNVKLLLDEAERAGLQVNFHLEPFPGRTAKTSRAAIVYLIDKYGDHPALFRDAASGNRPLFYVYDSYLVPAAEWAKILAPRTDQTIRGTPYDSLVIGLWVNKNDGPFMRNGHFDGFYTYFATEGFTYGSTIANWQTLAAWADEHDLLFVPCVGPGYDDTRIRPWNGKNQRARAGGAYYGRMFQAAIEARPKIIGITSFNEWHEGTQIEPAIPKQIKEYQYEDYQPQPADFYLKQTRRWSNQFRRQTVSQRDR